MNKHLLSGIQCLSFDLWLTLIVPNPDSNQFRATLLAEYFGVQNDDAFIALMRQVSLDLDKKSEETGLNFSCLDRVNLIAESLGRDPLSEAEAHVVVQGIQEGIVQHAPRLIDPDTHRVLQVCQDEGIRLALISNTGYPEAKAMRRVLDALDVSRFFSDLIFSSEVGYAKPSAELFSLISDAQGIDRRAVLHVGDSFRADYHGALNFGFQALLFDQKIDVAQDSQVNRIASIGQLVSL